MNAYIQSVIDTVKRRDNAKPEYIQSVEEVFSSLTPVIEQHPEYVEDRLKAGVIFGAFVDGRLAGFVGEHHEGSMGMLEVVPEFRRRGIAQALEAALIRLHRTKKSMRPRVE